MQTKSIIILRRAINENNNIKKIEIDDIPQIKELNNATVIDGLIEFDIDKF